MLVATELGILLSSEKVRGRIKIGRDNKVLRARDIFKYRRYAGASLILLVIIWLASAAGQMGVRQNSSATGSRLNLLSPLGINLAAKGGVQAPKKNAGPVGPIVSKAVKSDTSASLRSIRMVPPQKRHRHEANEADDQLPGRGPGRIVKDTVVQTSFGPLAMPEPIANF